MPLQQYKGGYDLGRSHPFLFETGYLSVSSRE